MEDRKDQEDDAGDGHRPGGRGLHTWPTSTLIDIISLRASLPFSLPDDDSRSGVHQKEQHQAGFDGVEEGAETGQEVRVLVVGIVTREHGQVADHVHQHEDGQSQSSDSRNQLFADR